MGVAREWCTCLSLVQGLRAASQGKHFCGHQRENTFGHNSGKHTFIFYKYKYVKIASLANIKSCVTVGPIH